MRYIFMDIKHQDGSEHKVAGSMHEKGLMTFTIIFLQLGNV